jgi:GNAT superfamily N-acetyltransferase
MPPTLPPRLHPGRLGPDDAGELLTLQRAAFVTEAQAHDDPFLPPLTQTLAELRAELGDPAVIALGVRQGGRLVGSVRVRVSPDGRDAELARLMVAPDQQGAGLGAWLLVAAERELPATVERLWLFTGDRSTRNLALYARNGYVETHRRPVRAHAHVYFEKDLTRRG